MSETVEQHRSGAPRDLILGVLTVSDTRTPETDESGRLIVELSEAAGFRVAVRTIVPDEPVRMRTLLGEWVARGDLHAILVTGGTGISPRDRTHETVSALLTRPLPGFGELFRMLSFAEIGAAAMLSRAVGGLIGELAVFVMPGSRAAVRLAMERLIVPELPHVVREARKRAPVSGPDHVQ